MENKYFLPQGLFFEKVVPRKAIEDYSYIQRMNIMMDKLIIEDESFNDRLIENASSSRNDPVGMQKELEFSVLETIGVNITDNLIDASVGGQITIAFEPVALEKACDELYLQIEDLKQSSYESMSDIEFAGRKIRTRPIEYEEIFDGNYDYLTNISSVAHEGKVTLTFVHGGKFSYAGIRLIHSTFDDFEKYYSERMQHKLENSVSVNGHIYGTINENNDGYVMVNLPYSSKWKCYIDGERTDILKVDYSFMACYVPGGQHEIEFVYLGY